MNKQIVVYTYDGILFSHKKWWSNDVCCVSKEPGKHYAKWKKPDAKGHMLYDCIYMNHPA